MVSLKIDQNIEQFVLLFIDFFKNESTLVEPTFHIVCNDNGINKLSAIS